MRKWIAVLAIGACIGLPVAAQRTDADKNATTADKERFMRSLDFIKGPEKEAALAEMATAALN